MRVIPTINWGDESTFDFCFDGVEKGSIVAVSTYMASAHGNREDQKEWFMAGYNEMLRRIEPEKIICYNTPFPEMQGDIVFVDYDKRSWRYMNEDKSAENKGILVRKTGYIILPEGDTIESHHVVLGGGSAYGGRYKPAKPEDERFVGKPGEIKITYAKDGCKIETHIGPNGLADKGRHDNGRPNPHTHSNPHDHEINFESPIANKPNFGPPINYWDGVPEFVGKSGGNMGTLVQTNSFEDNRFKTISDFKWSMKCGGEATFEWNGVFYGTYRDGEKYCICLITGENEQCFESLDDLLEFVIGADRLRDVITKVTVWSRNT